MHCVWHRFWVLPRDWAARVLTTWSQVIMPCTTQELCCNLSVSNSERTSGKARIPYSLWLTTYWARSRGYHINHTGLLGHGLVGANPHKPGRNCTLHMGCVPRPARPGPMASATPKSEVITAGGARTRG